MVLDSMSKNLNELMSKLIEREILSVRLLKKNLFKGDLHILIRKEVQSIQRSLVKDEVQVLVGLELQEHHQHQV